ncbi:MAG: HYC_CC_PP family protein [Bacteroides sp.]
MKKPLLIFLALVYTVISIGITVNMHYCMGHLAEVSWVSSPKPCCDSGASGLDSHCCSNQQITAKLAIDQQHFSDTDFQFNPASIDLLPFLWSEIIHFQDLSDQKSFVIVDPPQWRAPSLYVHHCTFLI